MRKITLVLSFFAAGLMVLPLTATAAGSLKALWIEVNKPHEGTTTIAVSVNVMKALLAADDHNLHFTDHKGKKDLITREMLEDLLNGDRSTVDVEDPETDEKAHLYIDDLDVPDHDGKKGHIVLETYKNGKREFRMSLGDLEIEQGDDEDNDSEFSIHWRKCLPFLSEDGGAIYVNDKHNETVVWVNAE
jgi:hypothetical protein